jgi:hypothetical protein
MLNRKKTLNKRQRITYQDHTLWMNSVSPCRKLGTRGVAVGPTSLTRGTLK